MITLLALPAITAEGQDTGIGVLISDESLREWLSRVRRRIVVENFMFSWAEDPRATVFRHKGEFAALRSHDGIYIEVRLRCEDAYRDVWYPIDEFCRMMPFKSERPSLGWCITVTVQ